MAELELGKEDKNLVFASGILKWVLVYSVLVVILSIIGIQYDIVTFFAYYILISYMVIKIPIPIKHNKVNSFVTYSHHL